MPGLKPDTITGRKFCAQNNIFAKTKKAGLKAGLVLGCLPISFSHAFAQASIKPSITDRFLNSFHSTEILMLSVFCGAMSFALMSAFGLIRERSRIANENLKLTDSLSNMRAKFDLNEALINVDDQCIILWNGQDGEPNVMGSLAMLALDEDNKASSQTNLVDFEKWIAVQSLPTFQANLKELRDNATPFDMSVVTCSDNVLESQGRVSGAYAFIRFTELGKEREEFARTKSEHEALINKYKTVETLFEKLPSPIWLRDNSGNITWINDAYGNALDLSDTQQAIGKDWNLFDQEQRDEINKVKAEGNFYQGILPATVAGERKKLEVYSINSNYGTAGIAFDKSDVDEVHKTLEVTNDGYSKILDQIATAVVIFDKSKKLIFHNESFKQLWKLDDAILEGNPSNAELLDAMREQKLLPERPDWRKWRDEQLEIYQAIEPQEDWWYLTDGQTIRVIATPRKQGGCTWVFENVTERLALESNYNSLIRVQGETLDHLHEAVAVFGSNGKVRLFNPALQKLWSAAGIEVNEKLHIVKVIKLWTDTIHNPDDLKKILGKITGLDDERSDLSGRLELKNGTNFEYSLVPLPDGQSMLTLSDITANVNFEKALNERAEALEESDRLKSSFIQHVSYELRAPLTNISGFGEMLATPGIGEMNDKQIEYLSHINSSADELRMMVDDILDLASIDAGSMELELGKVVLKPMIEEVLSSFEPIFEQKGLKKIVNISDDCHEIIANEDRIAQVIDNLISNAANFSPDGGMINISAQRLDDYNEIRISDQGKGISKDQRKRVFDRFETQPHEGARKGSGLGLSIVLGFVELHGGTVSIEDAEPNGACFICRIPANPNIDQTPEAPDYDKTVAA